MDLTKKKCVPCEGGMPKFTAAEAEKYLHEVRDWALQGEKIHKTFRFKGFMDAIRFVNKMAEVAEGENHHPNFCVNYNKVEVTIWTHAVGGLTENDFILAAKLDALR